MTWAISGKRGSKFSLGQKEKAGQPVTIFIHWASIYIITGPLGV